MAVNNTNSQGYEKPPNRAAWFSQAPWRTLPFLLLRASQCIEAGHKLEEETFELTLLKGDILHYCQESLQENAKLVTASFHRELSEDKKFKDH